MQTIPANVLEELYSEHARRLTTLAAALVGPSDADDVVSITFARFSQRPTAEAIDNVAAYLTRAVVNEARALHRSEGRRRRREAANRLTPRLAPHQPTDPAIFAALEVLPIRQRAVLFLTYWADLTPASVASELRISEGAVRKHLARARATLRRELS